MSRVASLILVLAVALVSTSAATAATPKKWYWSEEQAESVAAAKVRIPYCVVFAADSSCQDGVYNEYGRPRIGTYQLNEVICTGADERGDTFTFARFKCRFTAGLSDRDYAVGRILVYPMGAAKIHWKLTTLARV